MVRKSDKQSINIILLYTIIYIYFKLFINNPEIILYYLDYSL